jgi:hypothetical protein
VSVPTLQVLLFHDSDAFNVSSLLLQLTRSIVLKRDNTVIDLTQNMPIKAKIGTVVQKTQEHGAHLSCFSATHLEEFYFCPILDCLAELASSPALLYLQSSIKVKLSHTLFMNLLSISALKLSQSFKDQTLMQLIDLCALLLVNSSQTESVV